MNETLFTFNLVDKYTPEKVISDSLKQIEEATRGYVVGKLEKYSGNIRSYKKKVGLAATLGALSASAETVTVDIQNDLGAMDSEKHRYEVFLTVKDLEHYKYRMMFVDYGTISYPVTIVMNEELAKEYSGKWSPMFNIASMKELEEMMNIVINSDTMIELIQSLINESLRKEYGKECLEILNISDNNEEI